jgi:GTP cyclohydrolase II
VTAKPVTEQLATEQLNTEPPSAEQSATDQPLISAPPEAAEGTTCRYVDSCQLPTRFAAFTLHGFADTQNHKEHVVLTLGDVGDGRPVLSRVHSECLTGDALFSLRCDCGAQLEAALERIAQEGRGAVFYLRQEGRGIGLLNKVRAYQLQDQGLDTVEANLQLGFAADQREYSLLKPMAKALNIQSLQLMTNNPRKVAALRAIGLTVVERIPHSTGKTDHNEFYLETKKNKLGHYLDEL